MFYKKIIILFILIISLSSCSTTQTINKGELYNHCNELKTSESQIDEINMSLSSNGFLNIEILLDKNTSINDKTLNEIFEKVKKFFDNRINNNEKEFVYNNIKITDIDVSILYLKNGEPVSFGYKSEYYSGDTIYYDDDLNEIDNFKTWHKKSNE